MILKDEKNFSWVTVSAITGLKNVTLVNKEFFFKLLLLVSFWKELYSCRSSERWQEEVPPFVTAHTLCASRDILVSLGICLLIQQYFCAEYDCVEKADLGKGYQKPKRKSGVAAHFLEIIELKFGRKLPYILCILTLFWNYGCLIICEKCVVIHIFLFGFQ